MQIVVLSNNQYASHQIILPSSNPTLQLRDLRHRTALDSNGTYVSAKSVSFLIPGAAASGSEPTPATVEMDVASASELAIIGSLRKLYILMTTLTETSSMEHKKVLADFEFLTKWHGLAEREKLGLYDRWACHELNFWLFKKDRGFFDSIVRPFIQVRKHWITLSHF